MKKPYAKYALLIVLMLLLSSISVSPLIAKNTGVTNSQRRSIEESENQDCSCDHQQNDPVLDDGGHPIMTSAEDEEPEFGNRYEFSEFTIVDGWTDDDFLEYKITCDANEYGDTIVVHLQTGLAEDLSTIDYNDYINITLVGEYYDGEEYHGVQEHYRLRNDNQQDVQGLSDSIYLSYVPLELEEIFILLKATDSTPFLTEGSWVEIRDSDEDIQIYQQAGDCSFNDNLHAYQDGQGLGSLGQAWAFADGYHLSYRNFLRYRTDVTMYNYKGFSPLKNTGQRKADIYCGVSWAGTCDVNSVWPTGCGDWGYHIGTGLSTETPLYGEKIACQRLAKDGTSLEEDFMENVAETLLIDVIPELAEELAGEAILPPFAGEIFTILQFTIMMFDTDESVTGSRILKYEDVPIDPDEYYSLWTKLTLMARAGGSASSYVNFKYSGDPFITEPRANKHQKGVWLHNILIYYHPQDAPVIDLENPQEHSLLAKDDSLQFKARATGGNAPYSIKLERKTKNQTGHTIATTTLNTWSNIQDGTTIAHSTSALPVGEHLIVVTVTDANGAIDSDYEVVEVLEPPATPTMDISLSNTYVFDPYLLRWSKEDRAVQYEIKESTDGGSTWQTISTQNWNFTPLVKTTFGTYQYQVRAYDKIGQPSPSWSNIVSITIRSKPLSAPLMKNISSIHGSGQKYGLQWEYLPLTNGYEVEEYQWVNVTSATEDTIERKLIHNISFGPHHEDERIQVYYDHEFNKTFVKFKTINFTHSVNEKTTYEYRVAGRKADGTLGNWSRRQTTEIMPAPQSAPRLLNFTNSVAKNVYYSLYWIGNVSDAEWYRIEEDTSLSFNPSSPNYTQRLADTLTQGVTFFHVPLSTTTYYYRIRAENAGGPGPWSNVVNRTVTVNVKPEQPTLKSTSYVIDSGETFTLNWNPVNGERGYILDESKHGPYNFSQNDIWGIPHHSKTIVKTCEDSTEFSYRVRSFNPDGGYGDWSETITVLVIGTKAPETPVLYDPGQFSANHQAYDLEWKVTTDNAYIFIEEDTDSSFSTPYRWGSVDSSDTKLSDTHSKITKTESESANYYYRIRVKNGHGYSHWSNIVAMQILVPDCELLGWSIPLAPPVITTPAPFATINSSQPFWINWSAVGDTSFYILEEGEFFGGTCQFYGNEVYNGPDTSVQIMRPQSMMNTVCYRVKAANLCGLTGLDPILPSIQLSLIPVGGGGGGSGDGGPHNDSGRFGSIIDLFHGSLAGNQRLEEKLIDPQLGQLIDNRFGSIDVDGSDGQDQEGEHGFIDRLGTIIRDFNGDTTLDIIKIEAGGIVRVLDETGSTLLELSGIGSPSGICTGDYNGDDQDDLLISNYENDSIGIYDASGLLIDTITTGVQTPQGVAFGDYNNDGVNDIAIAQGSTGTVSIRTITGTVLQNITHLDHPQAVCIQDYNGDGYQDLLVTCADNTQELFFGIVDQIGFQHNISTYDPYNTIINTTARNLPLPWKSQLNLCTVYYEQVLIKLMGSLGTDVGDFNNDGLLELSVVEGSEVNIYDPDGIILRTYAGLPALPRDVALGDLTGNGECDVAITLENNEIGVYDNQGFLVDILQGYDDPRGIDIGDWDGDQQNEFIVAQTDRLTIETMTTILEEITDVVNPQGVFIQPEESGNESIAYVAWIEEWNDDQPHIGVQYQQSPPYQPHAPTPPDESTGVSTSQLLSFTGGDPDDTVLYDVALGDQFGLETVASDQVGTTYAASNLELNTAYYWQITAHDSQGHITQGPIWKFTTRSNNPPNVPSNPTPLDEETGVPVSYEIGWQCTDPESDTIEYDLYFGTTALALDQVISNGSSPSYDPLILEYDTTYYWSVTARDAYGYTSNSPLWSFTTGQPESIIPVGHWRFNEGTGGTTEDETIYDNQGTINGATWTPRDDGYSLYFEGSDDVTIANSDSLDITEPFMVEAWIKLTGSNPNYAIVDKYQYISESDERGFTFYVSDGKLRLSVYDGPTQSGAMGISELRDDNWHHVKALCTGTQILLYVDGDLEKESPSTLTPMSTTNDLGIGKRLSGWGGYMPFHGQIENVRLTRLNNPPNTPSNPSPIDGATNIPITTSLSWICSDSDYNDYLSYNVYFGTSPSLRLFALNRPQSSILLPTLNYDTTYQWQIKAMDSYGATNTSPIWQFTTEQPTTNPDIVYVDDDYYVGGDNDGHIWGYDAFDTIQEGVNAVNTSGLVTILSGTYTEQVTINKPLSLTGENKDTVIIDGQNTGNVVTLSSNNVDLSEISIMNAGTGHSGIVLDNVQNTTLFSLVLTGNENGIYVDGSSNNHIYDIYAYENSDDGVELYQGSNYNTIEYSTFYENGAAVFIWGGQYNTIHHNTITDSNGFGVQLYDDADFNTITYNTITGTTREIDPDEPVYGDAICLFYYQSQSIQGCIIENNDLYENLRGITLRQTQDSTIRNNVIENNSEIGLHLFNGAYNNILYHNAIINNNIQAEDEGSNQWDNDYPIGGNFWSDYSGYDLFHGPDQSNPGSDGIGDTPYNITGGSNQDRYPQMDILFTPNLYITTNLGVMGDPTNASYAYGLNEHGQIVGCSGEEYGLQEAYVWENGQITALGTLGGLWSRAEAINETGVITGSSHTPLWRVRGFMDDNQLIEPSDEIGVLPNGNVSHAHDINNQGYIVGTSYVEPYQWQPPHAFMYHKTTGMNDLGVLSGYNSSVAHALNENNWVVGACAITDEYGTHSQAFLWEETSGMVPIETLPGTLNSYAYDINDQGQVVGYSHDDTTQHAFLWDNYNVISLPNLGGPKIIARAINNHGQIVGSALTSDGAFHAVLWQNEEIYDLNSLLLPDAGWDLIEAFDINDNGQIIGHGIYEGNVRAFLLEPYIQPQVWITEPMATSSLYEPDWQVAVISEQNITVKAMDLGGSHDIVSTLFEYSADGETWYEIGEDTFGGFEGVIHEEYNDTWWGPNSKVGDEGWSVFWNLSILSEGNYYLKATMTDELGTLDENIRPVRIDRVEPLPTITSPAYLDAVGGTVDFTATTLADDIVQMELYLVNTAYVEEGKGGPSSGWFRQTGLGSATQSKPGTCAPTAAANGLAGQQDNKIYPPGKSGDDQALADELEKIMGTTDKGTNAWKKNTTDGTYETDNIGDGLKSWLEKRKVGCSNKTGYEVKTYRTKVRVTPGKADQVVPGSNEITFKDYNNELRKNQSIILWGSYFNWNYSTNPPTIEPNGHAHALTGKGANSKESDMGPGSHEIDVLDTTGQTCTTTWYPMGDGQGNTYSSFEYPPGSEKWFVILGMWAVSPKGRGGGSSSTGIGVDPDPSDGLKISVDTTNPVLDLDDGYYTFVVETTDAQGFIGSETTTLLVDNTKPVTTISPLSGVISQHTSLHLQAEDGEGAGVGFIHFEIYHNGLFYMEEQQENDTITFNLQEFGIYEGQVDILFYATDAAGNIEEENSASYLVIPEGPAPWITQPMAMDFLYEENWTVAPVTDEIITIKTKNLIHGQTVVNTTFSFSEDGESWTLIGYDDEEAFEGYTFPEGQNPRIGDEGWSVLWDTSGLTEGNYFIQSIMIDENETQTEDIRPIHIDRNPPHPRLLDPEYATPISGTYEFHFINDGDILDYLDFYIADAIQERGKDDPPSSQYEQQGIGSVKQGDVGPDHGSMNRFCGPTAVANALAGLNNKKVYPPGQNGNDTAVAKELVKDLNTCKCHGTNPWKKTGGPNNESTIDGVGDGIKAFLERHGIGCSNKTGYEVKTYGTKVRNNSGAWQPVEGSNEITFKKYNDEIRRGQKVVLFILPVDIGDDGTAGTGDDNITGDGHFLTGQAANSETVGEGAEGQPSYEVGVVDPADGEESDEVWEDPPNGNGFSNIFYNGDFYLVLGMWAISPKKQTTYGAYKFYQKPDVSEEIYEFIDTTQFSDGYHTMMFQLVDENGFIATNTTTIQVDNTPPDCQIQPPDGPLLSDDTISIVADDFAEGSGIDHIYYEIVHNGIPVDIDEYYGDEYVFTPESYDIFDGIIDITAWAIDNVSLAGDPVTANYLVENSVPPEVFITDPAGTGLLYHEDWQTRIIPDDMVTIKAYPTAFIDDVESTTFSFSENGVDWVDIGTDITGDFVGYLLPEEDENRKFGDEGWSTFWDTTDLAEGVYYLKSSMDSTGGEHAEYIQEIFIDRQPPIPELATPGDLQPVSGDVFFDISTAATDCVHAELVLFNQHTPGKSGPGWFTQNGLGNASQGNVGPDGNDGTNRFCGPTAAANALAGQNDSRLYPPGQNGNVTAMGVAIANRTGTDRNNGTNTWKPANASNPLEGETDHFGSSLRQYLADRGVGCNNPEGYEVTVYGIKARYNQTANGLNPVPGSNTATFENYNNELRKGQAVILGIMKVHPGPDGDYQTGDDILRGGHAITGEGANSEAKPDGSHTIRYVDPDDGTSSEDDWSSANGFSYLSYDFDYYMITGMWAISKKNQSTVSIDDDFDAGGGWACTYDSTTSEDGYHTLMVELTDVNGFVGTDTVTVLVDNTPPESSILPPGGTIYPEDLIMIDAFDGGSGVESIHYEVWWDSNGDGIVDDLRHSETIPDVHVEFSMMEYYIEQGWTEVRWTVTDHAQNSIDYVENYEVQGIDDTTPPESQIIPEGGLVDLYQPIIITADDFGGSGVQFIHLEINPLSGYPIIPPEDFPDDEVLFTFFDYGIDTGQSVEVLFFAVDNSGNEENPHNTFLFDVMMPPLPKSNINDKITSSRQEINNTPTLTNNNLVRQR